ncbi:MAG TPA: hypothetical protein VNS88_16560 [Nitrospiraceae bacterium]|nr:hypothetical protein [Nitrospiraceae bacterium]
MSKRGTTHPTFAPLASPVGVNPQITPGAPPGLAERVRLQLESRKASQRWLRNPTGWLINNTTSRFWSKQKEIANAVVRYPRVSVRSAHDTGKSFTAAQMTAWWLSVHPLGSAFVVTTAPTAPQVEVILWREIGKVKRSANLPGRITSGNIPKWKTASEEIIAYGRKPADLKNATEAAQAFQGIHARYILVIMDEACGIPEWLWNAVETIATNKFARVLAIGNPDVPETPFEKTHLPTSRWKSLKISAFDTPAFTGEDVPVALLTDLVSPDWVDARKQEWGEQSPLYMSKVLAEFPEVSEETLIHPRLIQMAQFADRSKEALDDPGRFGLDIARSANKNENACYRNRAGHLRLEFANYEANTMRTAGRAVRLLNRTGGNVPMVVDTVGVGGGVHDRLKEQGFPVQAFVASEAPTTPTNKKRFVNRRSEQWWNFRKQFEQGMIDLPSTEEDAKLISQLMSIRYIIRSDGKILVEPKEDMEDRGLPSPDRADAAMMACADNPTLQGEFYLPPPSNMSMLLAKEPGFQTDIPDDLRSLTEDLLLKRW